MMIFSLNPEVLKCSMYIYWLCEGVCECVWVSEWVRVCVCARLCVYTGLHIVYPNPVLSSSSHKLLNFPDIILFLNKMTYSGGLLRPWGWVLQAQCVPGRQAVVPPGWPAGCEGAEREEHEPDPEGRARGGEAEDGAPCGRHDPGMQLGRQAVYAAVSINQSINQSFISSNGC